MIQFQDLTKVDQVLYKKILETINANQKIAFADELMCSLTAPGKLKAIKQKSHHALGQLSVEELKQYEVLMEMLCGSENLIIFDQQMSNLTPKAKLQAIQSFSIEGDC